MGKWIAILLFMLLFLPSAAPPALPACTQTQHDSYQSGGYPTWHPQIDYVQGCVFDHL